MVGIDEVGKVFFKILFFSSYKNETPKLLHTLDLHPFSFPFFCFEYTDWFTGDEDCERDGT